MREGFLVWGGTRSLVRADGFRASGPFLKYEKGPEPREVPARRCNVIQVL